MPFGRAYPQDIAIARFTIERKIVLLDRIDTVPTQYTQLSGSRGIAQNHSIFPPATIWFHVISSPPEDLQQNIFHFSYLHSDFRM